MIMRWICEKCGKKWIYPIEKCLYCKGPIAKQKGKKARIIGVTKVNIPSPMHPIVPYHIILLEDEFGNRMPKKTMKEHRIGEAYEVAQAKTEGAVVISRIKYDQEEALRESLGLLKSFEVGSADRILIKVSAIEPSYPYQSIATNPKLLENVIILLKEKGVSDIIIGEQALLGNDTMDAVSKSGTLEVCKKHNVDFVDLGKSEMVEKGSGGMSFKIAKEALERKIINVPVMKTNSQLGISGGMENLIRVCAPETQIKLYQEGIDGALPKLVKVLSPWITIGDATNGLQGNGPTALGEPAFLNMILVSKDPVTLDRVFSEIGMFPLPNHIKEAGVQGVGETDLKKIEVVSYEVDAVKYPLKRPEEAATAHPRVLLIDGKADPYCYGSALRMAGKLFGLSGDDMHIAIGRHLTPQMFEGKRRIILYGSDAIAKGRALGIEAVAELTEEMPDIQRVVFLKSILENPDKKKLGIADTFKAKLAMFATKGKK